MGNVDIISKIFVQSDCCATFSQTFPILTKTPEFYLPNFPNTITLRSRTMLATVQNLLKGWGDGGKTFGEKRCCPSCFQIKQVFDLLPTFRGPSQCPAVVKNFLITIIIENQQKREAGYF